MQWGNYSTVSAYTLTHRDIYPPETLHFGPVQGLAGGPSLSCGLHPLIVVSGTLT